MTDGNNGGDGVISVRSHGWVKPRRGVDIKIGIGRQVQVPVDALKVRPVVIRQKECMRRKFGIRFVQAPEEADGRAGEVLP